MAAPAPGAQQQALELAAPGARMNFFGGLPRDHSRVELDTNLIHYRELVVTGTTANTTEDCREALELAVSGQVDTAALIGERRSIESGAAVEREPLGAVFEAARSTGPPVLAHTERGHDVEGLADLILEAGLGPDCAQLSHVDKRPDLALHAEMARAGFLLGYDSFLRPKYDPEHGVWPLLKTLIGEGLWRQIALGTDLVDRRARHASGGPGLHALIVEVEARLRREGIGDDVIEALAGGNALRLLARRSEVMA